MENYVVLDLETKKLSDEVEGGWNNIPAFGVAIAVLWHEGRFVDRQGFFSIHAEWHENRNEPIPIDALSEKGIYVWDIDLLIAYLRTSEKIVSFNGIAFDYEVLRPYGLQPELLYPKSFDILDRIKRVLGHRVSLQSVAQATLNEHKTRTGVEAVRLFKEGKIEDVIDYCKHDVEITNRIYQFIRENGYCNYLTLNSQIVPTPDLI